MTTLEISEVYKEFGSLVMIRVCSFFTRIPRTHDYRLHDLSPFA